MTLMEKNATKVDETIAAIQQVIPDFTRKELHLNIGHESGHYFANRRIWRVSLRIMRRSSRRSSGIARPTARRVHPVHFLEDRYQALIPKYYETHKSPLPCSALSSSCFIDAYWNLFACSIWDAKIGNLREQRVRSPRAVGQRSAARSFGRMSSKNAARTAGRPAKPIPPFSGIWARLRYRQHRR